MTLKEVNSSNIKRIGYEGDTLLVEYLSGSMYAYKKVPKIVFDGFLESDSKGRFMNNSIKGKYEYEKIS